jgi:hypothetical protein
LDFLEFSKRIANTQSPRWSPRQKRLDAYARALRGKMYDHLPAPFSQERRDAFASYSGNRLLLDERRAAVQDRLPLELTRDLVGMLFGEAHRPTILAKDDENTSTWIHAFIEDAGFWLTLIQATWSAAIGSGCVVLRVLGETEDVDGEQIPKGAGAFQFEVWSAVECRPVFKRTSPNELESIERTYFVSEDALRADGYDVDTLAAEWEAKKIKRPRQKKGTQAILGSAGQDWALRLIIDANEEKWFLPVPRWIYERADWKDSEWMSDEVRSFKHDLGEVPARWLRPLPIDADDLFPDGQCIFAPVIDHQFRIDRTLSQIGRAFDYAGDPQMVRVKGNGQGGTFGEIEEVTAVGGTASDMVDVGENGDAKFVEISGDGLRVAIETYIRTLRDVAREAGAMSRITPDSKSNTQLSAVAMKMLNFAQITLCDILRITLGEQGAIPILRLAMRMSEKVNVALPALKNAVKPNPDAKIELSWPDYYPLHGQDKLFEVQATAQAVESGQISEETAVANTAPMFDVQNSADEYKRVQSDRAAADERALDQAIATAAITAKSQLNISESEP